MDRSALFSAALRQGVKELLARAQRRKTNPPKTIGRYFRVCLRVSLTLLILAALAGGIFLVFTYRSYARIVDARLSHGYLISRGGIYAAPRTLRAGQKYTVNGLTKVLRAAGYVESEAASEVWNGSFSVGTNLIE